MQRIFCSCGQEVFYDNTECLNCAKTLGFDPMTLEVTSLNAATDGTYLDDKGVRYQLCANRRKYQACNGIVPREQPDADALCSTCQLNRTIPVVERTKNLLRWQRLETAKRRMVAGLTALGLHAGPGNNNPAGAMRFDFMEDKRSHPDVLEHFVSTGHKDGLITINLMEADEVQRVQQREWSGERQRTLLGHFRHEAGHYFYPQLVLNSDRFREVFGDPFINYEQALHAYYASGPSNDWGHSFISAYSTSHPLEDWAECFAHVLHIQDGLETAVRYQLVQKDLEKLSFGERIAAWGSLAFVLNEINRSLGVRDPYPFVISPAVSTKLEFVQQAITEFSASRP